MALPEEHLEIQRFKNNEASGGASQEEVKVRKDFPESWIFEVFDDLRFVKLLANFFLF